MTISVPNGTVFSIAASYGPAKPITATSNANPAVLTSAAHGFANGDVLEVTSNWSELSGRIARVAGSDESTFNLDGIDTTAVGLYPAGNGVGSARKVLAWTALSQIITSTAEGGEQQFATYQFLESRTEKRIPTFKNAAGMTLSVADDPTLPGYILAALANDDGVPRAVRATLPTGAVIYYSAIITLNKAPTLTQNEIMAVQVTLSLQAESTRYPA